MREKHAKNIPLNIRRICNLSMFCLVLLTIEVVGQSINSGEPVLDGLLMSHSVYGELSVVAGGGTCQTPTAGIIGSGGSITANDVFNVNTRALANHFDGGFERIKLNTTDTLFYNTLNAANGIKVIAGDTIQRNPVYPTLPVFPTLSATYPATEGSITAPGIYEPGDYNALNPSGNIQLRAGVYSFREITLVSGRNVEIIPDSTGSFLTIIYVQNTFTTQFNCDITVQNAAGYGKVLFIKAGASKLSFGSDNFLDASFIAPLATIELNFNIGLVGQVLGRNVSFLGYSGLLGQFEPFVGDTINDAPTLDSLIPDVTIIEEADTLLADLDSIFSDPEDSTLTFGVTVKGAVVTATIDPISHNLTVTGANNANGLDTVIISASDGELTTYDTIAITVTPVNDSPVFDPIPDTTLSEDGPKAILVDLDTLISDVDGDSIITSVTVGPGDFVTAEIDSNGNLTVTPIPDSTGVDTLILLVTDGTDTLYDTIVVTVVPVNDSPVFTSIPDTTILEDASTIILVDLNTLIFDADGDSIVTSVSVGPGDVITAEIDSNGNLTVTPQPDSNGIDTVILLVTDGIDTLYDTIVVIVTPVNDAPTIAAIADLTIPEDTGTVTVVNLDTVVADVDGDVLVMTVSTVTGDVFSVAIDSVNAFLVTTLADSNGVDTVFLSVTDGVDTVYDTVVVTVTPVDDSLIRLDTIPDDTIPEDTTDTVIIDLDTIFEDIDSELNYSVVVIPGEVVTADIDSLSGELSIIPIPNAFGKDTVIVTATDGIDSLHDTTIITVTREAKATDRVVDYDFGHIEYNQVYKDVFVTPNPVPVGGLRTTITIGLNGADSIRVKIFSSTGELVSDGVAENRDGRAYYDWKLNESRARVGQSYVAFLLYESNGTVRETKRRMIGLRK